MNKLLFSEGGQPLNLDDLEFMQTSLIDATKALASPWGNCVLTGNWEPTFPSGGGVMEWKDCMVYVNGKLAFLPASALDSAVIKSSHEVSAYIEVLGNEEASKTFADGSQHPTRKVYRAEMKIGSLPESGDVLPILEGMSLTMSEYSVKSKIKSYMAVSETDVAVKKVREGVSIRLKIKNIQGIRILFGEIKLDFSHGDIENFDGYICTLADEYVWRAREYWRAPIYGDRMGFRDVAFVICENAGEIFSITSPDEIRIVKASGEAPSRLMAGTYSFQCILP